MKRDIVTITEDARNYINQRCDGINTILGVSVNSKGCSGHQYEYRLIDPKIVSPLDETILWPGGGISISGRSVMFLIGSVLDIKRDNMQELLQWENPNATNHCGCGESFSVKT